MRKYLTALLLVGPILFISIICCTPSLHPLYTEEDLVFDPALLGVWADMDDGEMLTTWEFMEEAYAKTDPETGVEHQIQFYKLRYVYEDRIGRFDARLVALDDEFFLDLYPTDFDSYEMADLYLGHLIRAHTFLCVKQIEPQLIMGYLDSEWLRQYLADNPQAVGHDYVGEDGQDLLLTAPTEDLQAFMLECLGQEGSLIDEDLFNLMPVPESELAGITVSVTWNGEPAIFGPVSIYDSGNVLYREEWTDQNGVCRFTKLVPGTYSLRTAESIEETYSWAPQDITLEPGDDLEFERELTKVGDA